MESRFRPNRLDVLALVAVIVTTTLFLGAALNAADLYASVQRMSAWQQAAGFLGWLLATLGPITISITRFGGGRSACKMHGRFTC